MRKCSRAVCATWLSDSAAVHDDRRNTFECNDVDADAPHGSEEHV